MTIRHPNNVLFGEYDAIVVGAGLAGLSAGIRLCQLGHRVSVLERRPVAGGLCGTKQIDGFEFVVACNDFGAGIEPLLDRLGVPVSFHRVRTRFHLEDRTVELPVGGRSLASFLLEAPGALRAWRSLRGRPDATLADLARFLRSASLRDLVLSLGYPLGIAPQRLLLSTLGASLSRKLGYGYERPVTPVGGPAALASACERQLEKLGGDLRLDCNASGLRIDAAGGATVTTDTGSLRARVVITSEPPLSTSPTEPGLEVGSFGIALRRTLDWPAGVHTIASFPPDVGGWMGRLDAGEWPPAFGFHLFRSDLPERSDHYTVNVCCLMPRGISAPGADASERMASHVFGRLERILPGFEAATLYRRFFSPREFEALHGLSSRPVRMLPVAGQPKPAAWDPDAGLYRVGNGVEPPGDHAGQAVLSGVRTAELAALTLSSR